MVTCSQGQRFLCSGDRESAGDYAALATPTIPPLPPLQTGFPIPEPSILNLGIVGDSRLSLKLLAEDYRAR